MVSALVVEVKAGVAVSVVVAADLPMNQVREIVHRALRKRVEDAGTVMPLTVSMPLAHSTNPARMTQAQSRVLAAEQELQAAQRQMARELAAQGDAPVPPSPGPGASPTSPPPDGLAVDSPSTAAPQNVAPESSSARGMVSFEEHCTAIEGAQPQPLEVAA